MSKSAGQPAQLFFATFTNQAEPGQFIKAMNMTMAALSKILTMLLASWLAAKHAAFTVAAVFVITFAAIAPVPMAAR